jgi:excisionase family DNA binding protein
VGMNIDANSPPTAVAVTERPPFNRPQTATLLSVNDVCLALQCGRTFVYELLQKGELRPIKLGRLTRISRKELDNFLEGKQNDASSASGLRIYAPGSSRRLSGSLLANHRRTAHARSTARTVAPASAVEQPCLLEPDE